LLRSLLSLAKTFRHSLEGVNPENETEMLVRCQVLSYNLRMSNYKFFDHTADIGVEISGRTKKELFANAAKALFDILIENNDSKSKSAEKTQERPKTMIVKGADLEDLLINFLRETLYLFNGQGWIVDNCEIKECGNKRLKAQLMGEPFNKNKHSIKTEIKAVTYSGVSVEKVKAGWRARVIFDV
jgi:SHS2 domain-containing protein